jgi:hypothetical protein
MENKSKLRKLQEWSDNRKNWRIDYIFYPEDKGYRVTSIKNPMGYVSMIGIFLFLGGFAYLMIKKDEVSNFTMPVSICLTGFVLAAVGSISHELIRKRNWVTIEAHCLDHETKLGRTANNVHLWALRTLCKFEINNQEILCTPEATWPKRKSEAWKDHFIQERIEKQGICMLRVNPNNPHETELLRSKKHNRSR